MDYIEEIISCIKSKKVFIGNIVKNLINTPRYEYESCILFFIAVNQLNLSKNSAKGKFEDYTFDQLFNLLLKEVDELRKEFDIESNAHINAHRIMSEIGDIAAFLVGIISKLILNMKNYSNE